MRLRLKIRNLLDKHFAFYLLLLTAFIISIVVIEMIAKGYINNRSKYVTSSLKELQLRFGIDEKTIAFKNKYADRLHHLRSPKQILDKTPSSDLLFSITIPFLKSNNQNILIQGDSWAASAKYSKNFIKKFGKKKRFGIINAGVSSYSPSPMTIQLDILRDDFAIHPSLIIGIIDQTDIGDELFRYTYEHKDKAGKFRGLLPKGITQSNKTSLLEKKKNINSSKFSIVKSLNHASLSLKFRYLNRNVPKFELGPEILSPLVNGVDLLSAEYFFLRLNRYIKTVFADSEVKKLILVTHPHRNHLIDNNNHNKFKGEVGVLVDQVVSKSRHKDKILHIDFLKSDKLNFLNKNLATVFIKNDPFSHLTSKMYSEYYYPFIFSKLKNIK